MKKIAAVAIVMFTLELIMVYTSCKKDDCKNIVCKNEGVCTNGNCACTFAYRGSRCEDEIRSSYFNTYRGTGTDSDGGVYSNWAIRFYKLSSDARILGLELLTSNDSVRTSLTVQLQNANDFVIQRQSNSATQLSGYGSVSNNNASLHITDSSTSLIINFNEMLKP